MSFGDVDILKEKGFKKIAGQVWQRVLKDKNDLYKFLKYSSELEKMFDDPVIDLIKEDKIRRIVLTIDVEGEKAIFFVLGEDDNIDSEMKEYDYDMVLNIIEDLDR